jgi:metal-responsive CopG/Arc/MetJ family transcriptional regulator
MAKEKVQITMDSDLLGAVDEYCDKNYMNRSWMISQACIQLVNQQKLVDSISSMSLAIKKCCESGKLDTETRAEMESFEALTKLFVK